MTHQLHLIAGPERGRVFTLVPGEKLIVGRGQQSHTRINDPHMSRVHCFVEIGDGGIRLTDAGGKNTQFRGKPIESQELKSGDEFQAGATIFRYTAGEIAEDRTVSIPIRPLQGSASATPAAGARPEAVRPGPGKMHALIGQSFAHYRLDSLVATGSTGLVFQGTDTQKNEVVAIKVLFPDRTSSEEEKERFIRAMKTMLPIRHPNLIRLINAGKTGPYCWAVMEFIDGENLMQVIQRIGVEGMLDWRDVWRIAMDVTSALHAAYEHKVIHRNVIPKNIIQRKSDKVCLLGDLMLAKALEGTLAKQVTSPGGLVGELAFMSPERTRDNVDVDCRSDIYGLGATLYALLTGRPPIQADTTIGLIQAIRDADPEPPNKFQMSIHISFADLVMRMLKKRPDDRYENPQKVLIELERIGKYQGLVRD